MHTFVGANRAHNCKPCGTHEHTMVNIPFLHPPSSPSCLGLGASADSTRNRASAAEYAVQATAAAASHHNHIKAPQLRFQVYPVGPPRTRAVGRRAC